MSLDLSALPLPPPPNPPPIRGRAKVVLWIILLVLAGSVVLLNGRKRTRSDYRSASEAVGRFPLHLNARDYDAIYAEAREPFQRSGSHAPWIGLFEKAHQKLGNSGKVSMIAFYKRWKDGRVWVEEVVSTQFVPGEAHERLLWIRERDPFHLYWYGINSPESALIERSP